MSGESLPPQDIPAEEQVLGALMVDDLAIGQVAGLLRPEDFCVGTHRTVYGVMLTLHERREPTDISLVRAELERQDALEEVGGTSKLVEWLNAAPSAVNVLHYAGVVADRALRRRLIQAGGQIATLAYDAVTGEAAAAQAPGVLARASASRSLGRIVDFSEPVGQVWDEVSQAVDRQAEGEVIQPGLPTGLLDLDRFSGGMRPGELLLLAARPAMGKTSMAMQITVDVARRGKRVLVFSLEMGAKEVAARALWQRARINGQEAQRGLLDVEGIGKLAEAIGETAPLPIRVDDTAGLPVGVLVARARAEQAERGVDFVVVDYLQLLRGAPRRDGNRTAEVTEISQALKTLARDLGCPVLALSQLNRQVEHRSDARPQLSDLRDSGSLEQDADQVWLLWRDDPLTPQANMAVAKNRSGPVGAFSLRWDAHSTRFDPLETRFGS